MEKTPLLKGDAKPLDEISNSTELQTFFTLLKGYMGSGLIGMPYSFLKVIVALYLFQL